MKFSPLTLLALCCSIGNIDAHTGKRTKGNNFHKINKNVIPGQYIVTLKSSKKDVGVLSSLSKSLIANTDAVVTTMYKSTIQGFVVSGMTKYEASALARDESVILIEQDSYVKVDDVSSWGLDRIDQRDLPLNDSYDPSFKMGGSGVTAYIIDTGVLATHDDFEGRAIQSFNSVGDGKNYDCHGHGTHVAGTVAGSKYGVAKNSNIVGVKVLGCGGTGSLSGVIAGIEWVMENAEKPAVVNMSLGGGRSQTENNAIKSLVDSGVTTIVAAGNDNTDACNQSPASEPTAITVGATDVDDNRSIFPYGASNWGTCLDIFAPGSNIRSAWIGSNTAENTISGTSMASPHACGVAALHLGEDSTLTPTEISSLLHSLSTPNKVANAGTGSPNRLLYVQAEVYCSPTSDMTYTKAVDTPNQYNYQPFIDLTQEEVTQGKGKITFTVKASNDVHIALGEDKKHTGKHYEIVLGGWGNNKSVMRAENQGSNLVERAGIVLDRTKDRGFRISWDEDELSVHQFDDNGCEWVELMRLSALFKYNYNIKHILVSTGWGSQGSWRLFE